MENIHARIAPESVAQLSSLGRHWLWAPSPAPPGPDQLRSLIGVERADSRLECPFSPAETSDVPTFGVPMPQQKA
jgi:hypothetical protein